MMKTFVRNGIFSNSIKLVKNRGKVLQSFTILLMILSITMMGSNVAKHSMTSATVCESLRCSDAANQSDGTVSSKTNQVQHALRNTNDQQNLLLQDGNSLVVTNSTRFRFHPGGSISIMSGSHVSHSPITISGDADFASQATAEGWPGNGTLGNPYVISGLDITATGGEAINITHTTVHFVLQDTIIHDASLQGIYLHNVTNGLLFNNTVYNNTDGIFLYNVNNVSIVNNALRNNSRWNGYMSFSSNSTFQNNSIMNGGSVGLVVFDSDYIQIKNNSILRNGWDGLSFSFGMNNSILGNNIQENTASGIALISGVNYRVEGNTLISNVRSGMYLSKMTNVAITNVTIANNGKFGINVSPNNNQISIVNAIITNNSWSGIYSIGSSNISIMNDEITQNSFNGIQIMGSSMTQVNTVIKDNIVASNDGNGIYIRYAVNTTLTGNDVRDNLEGIVIESAPETRVDDNVLTNDLLLVDGTNLADFLVKSLSGNTVNGLPLLFLVNQTAPTIPTNVGEIILINSSEIDITHHPFTTVDTFIEIAHSKDITIKNNSLSGIYVTWSNSTTISGNIFMNSESRGIQVANVGTHDLKITNNNITNASRDGILVSNADEVLIKGNIVNGSNWIGIYLDNSDNSSIIENSVMQNGQQGMVIAFSDRVTVEGNLMENNTYSGIRSYKSQAAIIQDNMIVYNAFHGISIYQSNYTKVIGNNLGFNGWSGVGTDFSYHALYLNNDAYNNTFYGLHITTTSNITVSQNVVHFNGEYGIYLKKINNSVITNNTVHDNGWKTEEKGRGVFLEDSSSMKVANNTIFNNLNSGIYLLSSENNDLKGNNIHDNHLYGIALEESGANRIVNNTFQNDGLILFGTVLANFQQSAVINNTVNGRELLYLVGETRVEIPDNVGQVILVNSHRINIHGQSLYNTTVGIQAAFSTFLTIYNNSFSDNSYVGLFLSVGTNSSTISWNNFYRNNLVGFSQARDDGSTNAFTYNFWDDGAVIDPDNDGIVDIPYSIEGTADSKDSSPLSRSYSRGNMGTPTVITPNGGETLSGVITIEWTEVVHPLGQVIRYDVYYSLDGGKSWKLLASNLIGITSVTWDTSFIENASTVLIKVIAIDAVANIATQDVSDGVFQIINHGDLEHELSQNKKDAGTTDQNFSDIGIIAGAASLLAILLGGSFLFFFRRKRS